MSSPEGKNLFISISKRVLLELSRRVGIVVEDDATKKVDEEIKNALKDLIVSFKVKEKSTQ